LGENSPKNLWELATDFDRHQQVEWNLVNNAVKFSEPGGEVRIDVTRTESTIRLVVGDTGKGIAAEHLKTIFERFRQVETSTTRQQGGLGLGKIAYLVEARGFVEAYGEGIGHGASCRHAAGSTPALAVRAAGWHPHSASTSLYAARACCCRGNVMMRAKCSVTRSSSRARSSSARRRRRRRCVTAPRGWAISDIGMPGEDGLSLLARIRALPPEGGDVRRSLDRVRASIHQKTEECFQPTW
jgi:hypothetical protein